MDRVFHSFDEPFLLGDDMNILLSLNHLIEAACVMLFRVGCLMHRL